MSKPLTSLAEIGRRIEMVREAMQMEPAAFARRIGWSPQALNNYEKGYRRPDIDQALKLVQATGVTLDYIYRGTEIGLPMLFGEYISERRNKSGSKIKS